jgi:hypothetical protein
LRMLLEHPQSLPIILARQTHSSRVFEGFGNAAGYLEAERPNCP